MAGFGSARTIKAASFMTGLRSVHSMTAPRIGVGRKSTHLRRSMYHRDNGRFRKRYSH